MALWQESMIRLARSDRLTALAQRQAWLQGLAGQFVSGPRVADAIACAQDLAGQGIAASLFYLGEYVSDPALIGRTVTELGAAIAAAGAASLDVCASVDPTQVGLVVDEATCARHLHTLAGVVLAAAPEPRKGHDALMIDMEDANVTAVTLSLHRSLREAGLPVAVTLQSYLHRTRADLAELVPQGAWVRLVKGAFAEPAAVAVRRVDDRNSEFRRCAALLLSRTARESGVFPAFATHDHRVIEEIITQAEAHGWPAEAYEFEMLHGVRPGLQRELARRGHRVRVYLPFGEDWFPYAIRRIGESPRNLRFATTAIGRRSHG